MAFPSKPTNSFAAQPRAPMRGQGGVQQRRPEDMLSEVAAARARAQQGQAPAMKPMSQGATPSVPSPGQQGAMPSRTPAPVQKDPRMTPAVPPQRVQPTLPAPSVQPNYRSDAPAGAGGRQSTDQGDPSATARAQALKALQEAEAKKAAQAQAQKDAMSQMQGMGKATEQGMQEQADAQDPTKNPGPGWEWDSNTLRWEQVPVPNGIALDDPGWSFADGQWTYDPDASVKQDLKTELDTLITGDPMEYGMSPEMLAAQERKIDLGASNSKQQLAQSMAGRGFGASGLVGTGFGNIDVGAITAKNDLAATNFQNANEIALNKLKTLATTYGNILSEEQRMEIFNKMNELEQAKFEYEKTSQDEADEVTYAHNLLADLGGEQWAAESLAAVLRMRKQGKTWEEILDTLGVSEGNNVLVDSEAIAAAKAQDQGRTGKAGSSKGAEEGGTTPPPGTPAPSGTEPPGTPDDVSAELNIGKWGKSNGAVRRNHYEAYVAQMRDKGVEPWDYDTWWAFQQSKYAAANS